MDLMHKYKFRIGNRYLLVRAKAVWRVLQHRCRWTKWMPSGMALGQIEVFQRSGGLLVWQLTVIRENTNYLFLAGKFMVRSAKFSSTVEGGSTYQAEHTGTPVAVLPYSTTVREDPRLCACMNICDHVAHLMMRLPPHACAKHMRVRVPGYRTSTRTF